MKILFYSPAFLPGVGGLETVVAMLAEGLAGLGCAVKVVTSTPGNGTDAERRYEVVRSPALSVLLSLTLWCDVFVHHNVSLKGLWPVYLVRRPFVIVHHGWYTRSDKTTGWQDRVKLFAARFASNIAVSRAVADHLALPCYVIPNPYRDDLFREIEGQSRDRQLVFLGRLVSDKGCDTVFDAMALLKDEGLCPGLTVIGEGPEERALRGHAVRLGIRSQVEFAGRMLGEQLIAMLNRHTILVVPSKVKEGFGLVALEGIACGCAVIYSDRGGLPEAVGPCGVKYPSENIQALADCIRELLTKPARIAGLRAGAANHLKSHQCASVVLQYLTVLENVTKSKG